MTLYFDKRSELDDVITEIVRGELKDEHIDELMEMCVDTSSMEEMRATFREGLARALRGEKP